MRRASRRWKFHSKNPGLFWCVAVQGCGMCACENVVYEGLCMSDLLTSGWLLLCECEVTKG